MRRSVLVIALAGCGQASTPAPEMPATVSSCPSILVPGAGAEQIVTDDASVYWSEGAAIKKIGKNGGRVATLAEAPGGVRALVLRDDRLFYVRGRGDGIFAVSTAGGEPAQIVTEPVWISDSASWLAFDDGWVYFIEPGSGHVKRGRADGSGAVQLIVASFQNVAVEALAVDGDELYYADSDGNLDRMFKAGGEEAQVSESAGWPAYLHPNGDYIYYSGSAGIRRVSKAGGAPEPIDADCSYCDFTLFGSSIYRGDVRGLHRIPLAGGPAQTLMTDGVQGLAIDASGIYFGSSMGMKRAPLAGCP